MLCAGRSDSWHWQNNCCRWQVVELDEVKNFLPEAPKCSEDNEETQEATFAAFEEDLYSRNPWLEDFLKVAQDTNTLGGGKSRRSQKGAAFPSKGGTTRPM